MSLYIYNILIPQASCDKISQKETTPSEDILAIELLEKRLSGADAKPITLQEAEKIIYSEYGIRVKRAAFPRLWTSLGIFGEYIFLTGEIIINPDAPLDMQIFTAYHELMHYQGYGSEAEANLGAFIKSYKSPDERIVRSGALAGLRLVLVDLYKKDKAEYNRMLEELSGTAVAYLQESNLYIKKTNSKVPSKIENKLNSAHTSMYGKVESRGYSASGAYIVDYLVNQK